eukprot:NODE_3371_length_366_cov_9.895899_g3289_i0.p1 GENE.NODE_3371_length_366_cov_9.895899_g3289_i0~~NODE_3371_length_366_cov_9.895899_g3289_i0.p1  ORF type:complete len:71 (-),score=1.30 NODE_3371_length_366_cov_9.895899_g3289_i0:103-315(-)
MIDASIGKFDVFNFNMDLRIMMSHIVHCDMVELYRSMYVKIYLLAILDMWLFFVDLMKMCRRLRSIPEMC